MSFDEESIVVFKEDIGHITLTGLFSPFPYAINSQSVKSEHVKGWEVFGS